MAAEFINRHIRLADKSTQCAAFHIAMTRDDEQATGAGVEQSRMAALATTGLLHEPRTDEGSDHIAVSKDGEFAAQVSNHWLCE